MSSPLTMLKKTRRAPLQGSVSEQGDKQKVPFKRNLLQDVWAAHSTEESSQPSPPLSSHTPDKFTSTSRPEAKQGAPPSDLELMSAMMQRVTMLEKTVKSQAQDIKHKEKQMSALEKKLRTLGGSDQERRCQQLKNQVEQMERFLGDYGLIWVGEETIGSPGESERTDGSDGDLRTTGPSAGRSFHVNFDLVLQRIKDLNVLAGEGESFVQTTASGAKLAKKDPVQLELYSDGMLMLDGPFRSYREHSAQQFMQDLMDGYFPSELQQRFPDGVPFEVHDRRHETFIIRLKWDAFPGEGRAVGGEKNESSFQLPGKKVTTDQFLSKLPKMVVKAGRVIDIRNSLRKTLQVSSDAQSSSSAILIDTLALQATTDREQVTNGRDRTQPASVVTLKVKSEDGSEIYMVKMWLCETVGHLKSYLNKHRGADRCDYDVISVYPRLIFSDDRQTLQSCGVSADSTLLLRKKQSTSQ